MSGTGGYTACRNYDKETVHNDANEVIPTTGEEIGLSLGVSAAIYETLLGCDKGEVKIRA